MKRLLIVRPEPGLSSSLERALDMGLQAIGCPLFRVEPVAWEVPEPADYDALLITSANAVRNAGEGLQGMKELPVHAVGSATADAARQAGLAVASEGGAGVEQLLASLPRSTRLLHLAGEQRTKSKEGPHIDTRIVYRSVTVDDPGLPPLQDLVVAVYSPRAGARLAELAGDRERTAIAAISEAAASACGPGWERIRSADRPDDASVLALAALLCHTSAPR